MAADYESAERPYRKKEVSRRIVGNKEMEHRVNTRPKVIATRRRRILGISDFLVILFFPMPCRCRRRAPREPTSPMNKTRRIQWKPVSTRDRRFVFFFLHLLLIYDACYVLTTDEACNRKTRGTDVVRCKLRNPKAYSSLSKTELRSEQLLVAKLRTVAHTFQTAWVSHNSNSWCLQTMKLIFKNGHVSVHLVPILKTKDGILWNRRNVENHLDVYVSVVFWSNDRNLTIFGRMIR